MKEHQGVWFCNCGAGFSGNRIEAATRLRDHARFRAEDEPGATHDPGLAIFRPDVGPQPMLSSDGLKDAIIAATVVRGGKTTNCPLKGVHEHAFRGPHRFHEWDPASTEDIR